MFTSTAAIILSAGKGERLSTLGDKPFLTCNGKTFLENIFFKIQKAHFKPIILVTNEQLAPKISLLNLSGELAINPNPEKGMLSSLICGLNQFDNSVSGFLLHPVDFPLVKQETYQRLAECYQIKQNYIIKPTYQNRSGHPVIFPGTVFDDLKKAPLSRGARYVLTKYPDLIHELPVDDAGILLNINTVELYRQYCGQMKP